MSAYQQLCAYLHIFVANLLCLHHNLTGGNWFSDHERIGAYYTKVSGILDELIERGLSLGIRPPTIAEAVLAFSGEVLSSDAREAGESYRIIQEGFRRVSVMLKATENDTPPDVQNRLQEWQYYLNLEADYKLARQLHQVRGAGGYDDD